MSRTNNGYDRERDGEAVLPGDITDGVNYRPFLRSVELRWHWSIEGGDLMASLSQLLDDTCVERLREHWITSVEDLVGALEADESSVGRLLELPDRAVKQLHEQALEVVDPEFRNAVERERCRSRQYGAWQPVEH